MTNDGALLVFAECTLEQSGAGAPVTRMSTIINCICPSTKLVVLEVVVEVVCSIFDLLILFSSSSTATTSVRAADRLTEADACFFCILEISGGLWSSYSIGISILSTTTIPLGVDSVLREAVTVWGMSLLDMSYSEATSSPTRRR